MAESEMYGSLGYYFATSKSRKGSKNDVGRILSGNGSHKIFGQSGQHIQLFKCKINYFR